MEMCLRKYIASFKVRYNLFSWYWLMKLLTKHLGVLVDILFKSIQNDPPRQNLVPYALGPPGKSNPDVSTVMNAQRE